MSETSFAARIELDRLWYCLESQEWTYGGDNTGTNYRWPAASYKITLSNNDELFFEQTTASSGGWTAQLIEWSASIQSKADDAGLKWFVEPRFVNDANPSDISGNLPSGLPSGLPGAPSSVIAEALVNQGISWRYVNFQICPGEPVPVKIELIEVADSGGFAVPSLPYILTTSDAILGTVNEYKVCEEKDKSGNIKQKWQIRDDSARPDGFPGIFFRETTLGEIPNCYFPCGFLSLQPPPPSKECTFATDTNCDNNGSSDTLDFTNLVTRRVTYCPGVSPVQDFFIPDPEDESALVAHTLVGEYVNCSTGERVDIPPPPCEDYEEVGILWSLKDGGPAIGSTVSWWAPPTFPVSSNSAPHNNISNIFSISGNNITHTNGAPDVIFNSNLFGVTGTSSTSFLTMTGAASSAETNGTDQLKVVGYIIANRPIKLRDPNGNTGERGGIYIDRCCRGELELLFERTTNTVGGDTGVFDGVIIPVGIHKIIAASSDLSAWQGLEIEASYDDGETYQGFATYLSKPEYTCFPVLRCKDTGLLFRGDMPDINIVTVGPNDRWHSPPACVSAQSQGYSGPTAEDIAKAIVEANRAVTPRVFNFTNEGGVQTLGFTTGTMGRLVSIEDIGTGFVRWSIDGSVPGTDDGAWFTTTGPYHASYNLDNVDLSLLRFVGSNTSSDYSVMVEIY